MMKKRKHTIIYYIIISALIAFFVVTSASLITLQTFWGKEKIKQSFIFFAKKNGIDLKIDKIKGILPFEYKLIDVSISFEDKKIEIKNLDFRIKFFPLIKNVLSFNKFNAEDINYSSIKPQRPAIKDSQLQEPSWIYLPLKIKFNKLKFKNLNLSIDDTIVTVDIIGKATLQKYGKKIKSKIKITRKDFKKSYADISLTAHKETRSIQTKGFLNIASSKVLSPFYNKDLDFAFDLNFQSQGSLDSYLGYFQKNRNKYEKIEGNAFGTIYSMQDMKEKKPFFLMNRKSVFSFDFVTFDDLSINVSQATLRNDLFKLYFDAVVEKDFSLKKSNLIFRINDLTKMELSPVKIFGSFYMQMSLENSKILSNYTFQNFRINNFSFLDLKGQINGLYSKNIFAGDISSSTFAFNQILNISTSIKLEKSFLNLTNFQIQTPSALLKADLALTPGFALIGNGTAHFDDLGLVQVLYPKITFNGRTDLDFAF